MCTGAFCSGVYIHRCHIFSMVIIIVVFQMRVCVRNKKQASFVQNGDDVESRTKLTDGLKMSLRTQPMSFVLRFTELGGLDCLLEFLKGMSDTEATSPVHTSVLGCLKALMNSTVSARLRFPRTQIQYFELSSQRQPITITTGISKFAT